MIARFNADQMKYLPFQGGNDFTTPILQQPPGRLRFSRNMEIDVNSGYNYSQGYERYDGRLKPSDGRYQILACTITGTIAVTNTVTGDTSGATGVVIAVAAAYVIVTKVTGTFQDAEGLEVSAVVQATTTDDPFDNDAPTPLLDVTYKNLAADVYRADIAAVPGSGSVFGVLRYNNVLYAWRNNVGGTAAVMHKSTAAGWVALDLGRELAFTSGSTLSATGSVELTGGGSGSVDSITVDSVEIMSGAVSYNTNLNTTATDVASNITSNTSVPNYTATAAGPVITITASDAGISPNAFVVVSSATTITTTDINMANGFDEISEGATITGATSGATAVITRVVLNTGTWAGGDAVGRVIFASQTGTFQAENLNVGSSLNVSTIAGNSTAITLLPSGKIRTYQFNFGGAAGTRRAYGCDGVNRGFEFDGTVYVPINTGMVTDTPSHITAFKYQLFFAFGSSVQNSSIGDPYNWSPVLGASEFGVGDDITGFSVERGSQTGGALAVFSRNIIHMIYGNNRTDFTMIPLKLEVGALEDSIQVLTNTIMFDDRGIINLRAAQEFGNFQDTILSQQVTSFIKAKKRLITVSCIVRDKNQYRIYFSDKTALYVTMDGGDVLGMMPQQLNHCVESITSVEGIEDEEIFFGSDDGFVYQMERGTSFDGDDIEWFGILQYWHCDSPRVKKRFKSAAIEAEGNGYAEYGIGYELGYGSSDHNQPDYDINDINGNFGDARWDVSTFGDFWWDADIAKLQRKRLTGSAENISLILAGASDKFEPVRFSGAILRYKVGRIIR